MERGVIRRAGIGLIFLAAVGAMTAGVFSYGYGQALDQLAQRGRADLALAADRLTGQLRRFQEIAVLLAPHPVLAADDREAADALLLAASDKSAALNIFYVDRDGRVLARANESGVAEVATGRWIERAMHGALGSGHGLYGAEAERAYFYAAPRFGTDGQVEGALVVVVRFSRLEDEWRGSRPAVFFVDDAGTVFVSNRTELLFWRRDGDGLGPPDGSAVPWFGAVTRAGREIWRLDWGPYIPKRALHLGRDLPVIGLRAEALVDVAPALRLAGFQAAAFAALWLVFGAFLYVATERRRALAEANRLLEARVEARTAELKRAQADLVQAGKLSALGQMSAGISHELNQPLMAIRQFADNGAAFFDRGREELARENLGRISALAARAARIIKNLRAFARNENEPMGQVDLVRVIEAAVELTEARRDKDGIELIWVPSPGPVFAFGGEVRLTQVFVNLINNAADAMAGQEEARVIRIGIEGGALLKVTVEDSGPGIADPDRIFEPFYSTKAVGAEEGMGLGLSISYGLVQSFGGNIRGVNRPGRGAVFTVELDHWREEQAA